MQQPTCQIISNGEESILTYGVSLSKQLPEFKPDADVHPNHFIRGFSRTLPTRWDDAKKTDFILCYLTGEAAEWVMLMPRNLLREKILKTSLRRDTGLIVHRKG